MLYHVRAANMSANYKLGDFEADSESAAIAFARRDVRRRNWGQDVLTGLIVTAFAHRPGVTCRHDRSSEEEGQPCAS